MTEGYEQTMYIVSKHKNTINIYEWIFISLLITAGVIILLRITYKYRRCIWITVFLDIKQCKLKIYTTMFNHEFLSLFYFS